MKKNHRASPSEKPGLQKPAPAARVPGIVEKPILAGSYLIFLFFFLMTRLPFFLYNPIILLSPDYPHYYAIVDQISKGFWPLFSIRTPGYPLFLALVFLFFKTNLAVIVIQNILTLLSGLFFITVIHKIYGRHLKILPLLVALALGAFISLPIHLYMDTALATESIYISAIILFFGVLFLAITYRTRRYWILSGISMAIIILIRPSGLFLVVLFLAIILFTLLNGYGKSLILLFSLSFIGPLMLMCLYNGLTIGSFSISTFTEHALISFTSTFLEKSPEYSPAVNRAIEKSRNRLTPRKKKIVAESWKINEISLVLNRHYNRNRRIIFQTLKSFEEPDADDLYMKWRPTLKKIALDAIRQHPLIYLKYLYANIYRYFFNKRTIHFYSRLQDRYRNSLLLRQKYTRFYKYRASDTLRLYYKNEYIRSLDQNFVKNMLKEYWNQKPLTPVQRSQLKKVRIETHFFQKIHEGLTKILLFLFHNQLWIIFFFFSFVFSLFRMVKTRFRHGGTFLFLMLTGAALLHGVVISMSSFSDARLSYPLDFIYYLSVFLFPILFKPDPTAGTED